MEPGRQIRVMVVDDSAVIRRLIVGALSDDPDLVVVGTASNGAFALTLIEEKAPDLVTLDIEMPEMDGIQMLHELRRRHPRLPVIMFSSHTEHGALATVEALLAGANDYILKPSSSTGLEATVRQLQEQAS
jgi:two-component system chemotaxis response regulator CheB